jgi:hypothetical protein
MLQSRVLVVPHLALNKGNNHIFYFSPGFNLEYAVLLSKWAHIFALDSTCKIGR